jgi:hypothetical protein
MTGRLRQLGRRALQNARREDAYGNHVADMSEMIELTQEARRGLQARRADLEAQARSMGLDTQNIRTINDLEEAVRQRQQLYQEINDLLTSSSDGSLPATPPRLTPVQDPTTVSPSRRDQTPAVKYTPQRGDVTVDDIRLPTTLQEFMRLGENGTQYIENIGRFMNQELNDEFVYDTVRNLRSALVLAQINPEYRQRLETLFPNIPFDTVVELIMRWSTATDIASRSREPREYTDEDYASADFLIRSTPDQRRIFLSRLSPIEFENLERDIIHLQMEIEQNNPVIRQLFPVQFSNAQIIDTLEEWLPLVQFQLTDAEVRNLNLNPNGVVDLPDERMSRFIMPTMTRLRTGRRDRVRRQLSESPAPSRNLSQQLQQAQQPPPVVSVPRPTDVIPVQTRSSFLVELFSIPRMYDRIQDYLNARGQRLPERESLLQRLPNIDSSTERAFITTIFNRVTGNADSPAMGETYNRTMRAVLRNREFFGRGLVKIVGEPVFTAKGQRAKGFNKKVGYGVMVENEPNYYTFGSKMIHYPSLKNGQLRVRYPSGSQVPSLPLESISEDMAHFIEDLIRNHKINGRLFEALQDEDKTLFAKMSKVCGVDTVLGLPQTYKDVHEDDIKRFELLRGSIIAGNNSPELLSELKQLTSRLMEVGIVSVKDGAKLLSL